MDRGLIRYFNVGLRRYWWALLAFGDGYWVLRGGDLVICESRRMCLMRYFDTGRDMLWLCVCVSRCARLYAEMGWAEWCFCSVVLFCRSLPFPEMNIKGL